MGTFVISNRIAGGYKISFAARKGRIVFTSIGFKQKSDCEIFIASIQKEVTLFSFTKVRNAGGKYFFRIAKDGLVIANSRKYTTELLLIKGIDQVHKYIAGSETIDFSDDAFKFPDEALFTETADLSDQLY